MHENKNNVTDPGVTLQLFLITFVLVLGRKKGTKTKVTFMEKFLYYKTQVTQV